MANETGTYSVDDHFAGKDPSVRSLYDGVVAVVRKLGPVREEAKKTSIHLVRKTALAGVQVRKAHLVLTVKADHPLDSPRVHRVETISARRVYHDVRLAAPGEIDAELRGWLADAYELSA
jgi:hypothetical protein